MPKVIQKLTCLSKVSPHPAADDAHEEKSMKKCDRHSPTKGPRRQWRWRKRRLKLYRLQSLSSIDKLWLDHQKKRRIDFIMGDGYPDFISPALCTDWYCYPVKVYFLDRKLGILDDKVTPRNFWSIKKNPHFFSVSETRCSVWIEISVIINTN